ncbi:hypothetical protein V8G54_000425 [Vigna mungo]|uniref:Uncharacterized protein n=1 Tax=Vigna mungo TaxID=3915 RepID=A0AAQ3P4K0_VIGMU
MAAACLRGCWLWGCIKAACTLPILLMASCRSYAKRSFGDSPGRDAAAGGGRGFEAVPGGVGLLPQEHYIFNNSQNRNVICKLGVFGGGLLRTLIINNYLFDKNL